MQSEIPLGLERQAGMPDTVPQIAVGFGMYPLKDNAATLKAGRLMFRNVLSIRKVVPGDKNSEIVRPATDKDKQEYPKRWQAYETSNQKAIEGTPLEAWPILTRAEVMNFKSFNIYTIEMLAQINPEMSAKLPYNVRDYISKANAYLSQATKVAAAEKAEAENKSLRDQLADLQKQITELSQKRGPGRPPKTQHEGDGL